MKRIVLAVLVAILFAPPCHAQCGVSAIASGVTALGNGTSNDSSCTLQAGLYVKSTEGQITAAATISPTASITHVTGGTTIETITVPAHFTSGSIILVPDSAFTWGTSGNISVAGTATINIPVEFTYDGTKWNPSYTSSSGSTGALVLIQKQTLGSTTATVTFSSIPQTYTNLVLVVTAATGTSGDTNLSVEFNSDTASNYVTQFISGTGSAAAASAASTGAGIIGGVSDSVEAPNYAGTVVATIGNYTGTTFYKAVTATSVKGGASNVLTDVVGGVVWKSTAAITAITVLEYSGGSFLTGSVFSLYGEN